MSVAAFLALAITGGAPPVDADVKKKAEALVAQLGHPDYRDREKAARQLLELGYPAKDAVLAGRQSSDTEISDRCTKLYPTIWRHDLDKRVQRFLDDRDGPIPDDLPGADRWLKIAGDGRKSREMYGEMLKAHSELLLDIEFNPERLRDVYTEFIRAVYARTRTRVPGNPVNEPTESEILLFYFLGAVDVVRPARPMPGTSSTYYTQFLTPRILTARFSDEPMRKLYAEWLDKERYSVVLRRAIDNAAQHTVKECGPALLKIAADLGTTPAIRATALLGFGKLGAKDKIKDLEPFLKDKLVIANVMVNSERHSVQFRDVALAAAVQLAGQDLTDFGFELRPLPGAITTTYTRYAFGTDEQREAAHEKWKEWVKSNLKK